MKGGTGHEPFVLERHLDSRRLAAVHKFIYIFLPLLQSPTLLSNIGVSDNRGP